MKQKVIAIVGMSGAGKSEAGEFFKNKGFPVLRFGSVVDEGIKEEGLEWNWENNTYYRHKIRQELGMAAIAIKMLPKIEKAMTTSEIIILDGLYSWEEYTYLKDKLPLTVLCIYARPELRYARLAKRKERPLTNEEVKERDMHEIEVINKGGPIAIADYLVKNETTKEDLQQALEEYVHWLKL